ncbi:glycoside hydrolase [Longimycelium tulufanense]|uniref:Glycoside hydrolase n=1 Tax=Longimycelium tulufanense TaxID=907463 RepID=A0A8J3CCH5_9PSEU|nr:glycoside hydrolase family 76 protein [Longimycelium tulufanense]GGM47350.1 glycoside hydrolase [Longimycelium tulufanense]
MTEQSVAKQPRLWAARAGVAERAIYARHLRRVWGLPGTALGVTRWPATYGQRLHGVWNYWWQAHLLDCLVDAQLRKPTRRRMATIRRLIRGVHVRNLNKWVNDFYDDVAWLGLALQRAGALLGEWHLAALTEIVTQLRTGWTDHAGGGIWWRRNDDFKNVPANGPAAILLLRVATDGSGVGEPADLARARAIANWIEHNLIDPATGLAWDGLHVAPDGSVRSVEKNVYTYCQGVVLGTYVELADATGEQIWTERAVRTIDAISTHLTDQGGVLRGHGGGDGGLFTGILARYLAQAALRLFDEDEERALAARLVTTSAEAAWRNRGAAPGGPLFGADWLVPATVPVRAYPHRLRPDAAASALVPELDLSVQLAGWMLLEASAFLEAHDFGN